MIRNRLSFLVTVALAALASVSLADEDKSGVKPQVLSLPSGPGSIEGLGGSFEPQLNTGTATYGIEISSPPGVSGRTPELSLGYNSGHGNGPFGIGWSVDIPSIKRQTDKGVPRYDGSDTFVFSDGEELVPIGGDYYRAENEAAFRRFRYMPETASWEVTEKDGTLHRFGIGSGSRIEKAPGTVFKWCLASSTDTNGNAVEYGYVQYPPSKQIYVRQVRYSINGDISQSIAFDYQDRPDGFGDYSSGVDIRTTKRCSAIRVLSLGQLVRRYALNYDDRSLSPPLATELELSVSILRKVSQYGDDDSSVLPSLRFAYYGFNTEGLSARAFSTPPAQSLSSADVELLDVDGDSLPDVVHTFPGLHSYYRNLGNDEFDDTDPAPVIENSPVLTIAADSVQLMDVDADGLTDLVWRNGYGPSDFHYFRNSGEYAWEPMQDWANNPFQIFDAPFRLVDLDSDKRVDVLRTTTVGYYCYLNTSISTHATSGTWSEVDSIPIVSPEALFSNAWVRLADMNGDRLQDLVRISLHTSSSSAVIRYWPMTGRHEWGERVDMEPPLYVPERSPERLKLTDINGDGLADVILIKSSSVNYWINKGNDEWTNRLTVDAPTVEAQTVFRMADMNGNGSTDILYDTVGSPEAPLQYLDFTPGTKPNLLHIVDNGLGQTTIIEYATSTDYYVQARGTAREWTTRLPIPVAVVSRMTTRVGLLDGTHADYVTEYSYWDGYYDGAEKEFRGFGYVEVREIGDATAPTKTTRHWFDVGDTEEALKGKVIAQEVAAEDGTLYERTENLWNTEPRGLGTNGQSVVFAFNKQTDTVLYEGYGVQNPLRKRLRTAYDYDWYGNVTKERKYGVIELNTPAENADPPPTPAQLALEDDEVLTFTTYIHDTTNWILDRRCSKQITDLTGDTKAETRFFYDNSDQLCPDELCSTGNDGPKCGNQTRQDEWLDTEDRYISTVRNEYDCYGNITRITDANNHFRTIGYDEVVHTFPTSETVHLDGYDIQMSATYDYGFGTVTTSTDFAGALSNYDYDTFGRLKAIRRPGGAEERYKYQLADPVSHIVARVKDGSVDSFFHTYSYFDGLGRELGKKIEAENGQWRFADATTFNARKFEKARWLPLHTSTSDYERPEVAYGTFPKITTEYDVKDRVVKTTNPQADSESAATYSRTVFEPLLRHEWDENDNAAEEQESGKGTPKTLRNDGQDRLVEVIECNHEQGSIEEYVTNYAWNTLGDLTQIEDAQCNVKIIDYDSLRRKTFMNDPDRGYMTYSYDDVGNLTSSLDAKGQATALTYDFANRIMSENYLDQTGNASTDPVDVTYLYDHPSVSVDLGDGTTDTATFTAGRLSSITDLSGGEHLSYDARGNVEWTSKHIVDPKLGVLTPYTTRFEYDLMDRVTDLYFPDNDHVHYEYNDASFAERIQGGSGGPTIIASSTYEPTGQLGSTLFGNGVETYYTYDKRDRLDTLQTGPSGDATLINYEYYYDSISNITKIVDQRPFTVAPTESPRRNTQVFKYDDLHRLTQVRYARKDDLGANHRQIGYAYDAIGNMLSKASPPDPNPGHIDDDENVNLGAMTTGGGTCAEGGKSGPCNRVGRNPGEPPGPHALTHTSNGVTPDGVYEYDDNGNMMNLNGATLTWDFKDRLVTFQKDGTYAEYTYDYTDRRISKLVTLDGRTTQTLSPNRAFEIRPNQAPTKFVFNGATRVARVKGTLDPSRPRVQRFWLASGWNLVTAAVETEQTIGDLFGTDATTYTWTGTDYVALTGAELATVGQSLWIEVPTSRVATVLGTYDPSVEEVVIPEGQSLVAWPRLEPFVPSTHLTGSARVQGYEPIMGNWLLSDPTLPTFLGELELPASIAFWIAAPDGTVITQAAADGLDILFYHGDHLGSTNVVSDVSGSGIRETAYYPFGHPRNVDPAAEEDTLAGDYGFAGKEQDSESALHYFEARYLLSSAGRFSNVDPLRSEVTEDTLTDPQTANLYAYCLNNPIVLVDPTGEAEAMVGHVAYLDAPLEIASRGVTEVDFSRSGPDTPSVKASQWLSNMKDSPATALTKQDLENLGVSPAAAEMEFDLYDESFGSGSGPSGYIFSDGRRPFSFFVPRNSSNPLPSPFGRFDYGEKLYKTSVLLRYWFSGGKSDIGMDLMRVREAKELDRSPQ